MHVVVRGNLLYFRDGLTSLVYVGNLVRLHCSVVGVQVTMFTVVFNDVECGYAYRRVFQVANEYHYGQTCVCVGFSVLYVHHVIYYVISVSLGSSILWDKLYVFYGLELFRANQVNRPYSKRLLSILVYVTVSVHVYPSKFFRGLFHLFQVVKQYLCYVISVKGTT